MKRLAGIAACFMAVLFCAGCGSSAPFLKTGGAVVGTDVVIEDVTEFYYTYDTSTNPLLRSFAVH